MKHCCCGVVLLACAVSYQQPCKEKNILFFCHFTHVGYHSSVLCVLEKLFYEQNKKSYLIYKRIFLFDKQVSTVQILVQSILQC